MNNHEIPVLFLSENQIAYLNLCLKDNCYLGKAKLQDNRTIKLYSFSKSFLTLPWNNYMNQKEFSEILQIKENSIYSPYYKMVISSLKDLVNTKSLELLF